MKKYYDIKEITFIDSMMIIIIDGEKYRFKLSDISPRLAAASETDRQNFDISPSGYGVHWPSIDEDLSIDGLLRIIHKPPRRRKKLIYKQK